jgi:hypothetical protein
VVILGTEQGIFISENIGGTPTWEANQSGIGNVPVFDLKQQLINKTADTVRLINGPEITVLNYPGTNNYGIIYGATFGKGLYRCNQYRRPVGVFENPSKAKNQQLNVRVYPNPVNGIAFVDFELSKNSSVGYSIFDLTGKVMQQKNIGVKSAGKIQLELPVNELKQGSYILRIESAETTGVVKFLVY